MARKPGRPPRPTHLYPPTTEYLRRFLYRCLVDESLNFPAMAQKVNLDWKAVAPLRQTDPAFRAEFLEMLERFKFRALEKLANVALGGQDPKKKMPNKNAIVALIDIIDSGILLGDKDAPVDDSKQKEATDAALKRMGIDDAESE